MKIKLIDHAPKLPPGHAAELIALEFLGKGAKFLGGNTKGFDLIDGADKNVQVKSGRLKYKTAPGKETAEACIGIKVSTKTDYRKFDGADYLVIVGTSGVAATASSTEVECGNDEITIRIEVTYPAMKVFRVNPSEYNSFFVEGKTPTNIAIPLANCITLPEVKDPTLSQS